VPFLEAVTSSRAKFSLSDAALVLPFSSRLESLRVKVVGQRTLIKKAAEEVLTKCVDPLVEAIKMKQNQDAKDAGQAEVPHKGNVSKPWSGKCFNNVKPESWMILFLIIQGHYFFKLSDLSKTSPALATTIKAVVAAVELNQKSLDLLFAEPLEDAAKMGTPHTAATAVAAVAPQRLSMGGGDAGAEEKKSSS
jgi:hypothetical protein